MFNVQITHTAANGEVSSDEVTVSCIAELEAMVSSSYVERGESLHFACADLDYSFTLTR